ncbi:hypothetical protein TB1_000774 [Malus domestica]
MVLLCLFQLSFDLVEEWIRKNPKGSICTAEGIEKFRNVANFQDYHGLPEFRQAISTFMSKARGDRVTFDPHRVDMSGGATGAGHVLFGRPWRCFPYPLTILSSILPRPWMENWSPNCPGRL